MTEPTVTLKPCPKPWCDGPARLYFSDVYESAFEVTCLDCSCSGPSKGTEAEAIAAWNTRAASAPAGEVEPWAWEYERGGVKRFASIQSKWRVSASWTETPLYAHPPAPADLVKALREAVALYGKPGGPWNVPSDPGGWLDRARAALAKHGAA